MKGCAVLSIAALCFTLTAEPATETRAPGADSAFAREMMGAHNAVRAKLGLPPLAWSDSLAERSQQWAEALIHRGEFTPRRDGVYGENLFEIMGDTAAPSDAVNAWASEAKDYNAETNTCSHRCGHYTQLVWRDTKYVGCGVAGNGKRQVWVCNYDPAGNVSGQRPY